MPNFIDDVEQALHSFHRMLSKSKRWEHIAADANVQLDRTSAAILVSLAYGANDCRMQDIVEKLDLEPAVVTRKIQHLTERGYVSKATADSDKRAYRLEITQEGQAAANRIRATKRSMLEEAFKTWTDDERAEFVRLLRKFADDSVVTSTKPTNTNR